MSNPDPTGCGRAVALSVPAHHAAFLRHAFTGIQAGLLEDLTKFPDGLQDPDRSRREADACGRLLAALDSGVIVPDRDVLDVLNTSAQANDDANEYERVVFEHRACCGLLGQVESAGGRR